MIINNRWYLRRTESDGWVIPYDPDVLMEIKAHHCIEYCTNAYMIEYIAKYMLKCEPTFGLGVDKE